MMLLKAKYLLPVRTGPVEAGAVLIRNGVIESLGTAEQLQAAHPQAPVLDLGGHILLPGLLNAHCHLDYMPLRNLIHPTGSFTSWIQKINGHKRTLATADYLAAVGQGYEELLDYGTTTAINIEAFPELLPLLSPPPLRVWWCAELIDIRVKTHDPAFVDGLLEFFYPHAGWRGGFGLSPHAPYTASSELYGLAREAAGAEDMLVTTHIAESVEEYDMFQNHAGRLHDFLGGMGRRIDDINLQTPFGYLMRRGLLPPGSLAVHMNYVTGEDLEMAEAGEISVAHCPKCHEYFGHRPFPLREMQKHRINLCLGTDSVASNNNLNLFEEMQCLARKYFWLEPRDILRMVTLNPARVLRQEGRLGEMTPGAHADLIALPYRPDFADAYQNVLWHKGRVPFVMVGGEIRRGGGPSGWTDPVAHG
ncbi:MAG: amidohydrolase family protein [Verrucomicrobiae bacterium]|nr:amidohydrolase family protein [Verrucomicrobiae bacterium]